VRHLSIDTRVDFCAAFANWRNSPILKVRQLPYFQRVTVGNWFAFLTASEDAPMIKREEKMLRIRRSVNAQVVFRLSGRMGLEETVELETLIKSEKNGLPIVLDLKDVTLVGQDAIAFLERCEADSITLKNCAEYVREWITRQRDAR
jgi:hypothetical protein